MTQEKRNCCYWELLLSFLQRAISSAFCPSSLSGPSRPSIAADSLNSTDSGFGKKNDFAENALAFSTLEKYCKSKRHDAAMIDRLTERGSDGRDHPEFINYSIFHVNI